MILLRTRLVFLTLSVVLIVLGVLKFLAWVGVPVLRSLSTGLSAGILVLLVFTLAYLGVRRLRRCP